MNESLEAWFKKVEKITEKKSQKNTNDLPSNNTQKDVAPQNTIEVRKISVALNEKVAEKIPAVKTQWSSEGETKSLKEVEQKKEKGRSLFRKDDPYFCVTCGIKSEVDFYGIRVCSWACHESEMKRLRALRVHTSQKRATW